ncbi:MAG TPA: glycosyltransferase family 39 protein [Candidatus Krumholzibacteria bacterium]|nr:glycosyltransferase family 39 protein [Candidatus Krumholzibacteria bacterium]
MSVLRNLFSARALSAILIVAALTRFGFGAYVVGLSAATKGDETDYHAIANHLAAGRGFVSTEETPTARRPPAYPVFLSLLYRVSGANPAAGRVAQIILGVVVVWLTVRVTRVWFDERAAVWAGWLAALNPFLIFVSGYLLTENLYLVFLLGAMVLAATPSIFCRSALVRAALAGALLALAALARPSGLPMLEWMLAAALLFGAAPWRLRLTRVALAAVVFGIVMLPWLARNARVVGAPVLTTHGGMTFYQGNNEKVATTPQWRGGVAPLEVLPEHDRLTAMSELERDRAAWQLGREYLQSHPGEVPSLVFWKLVRCWRLKSDMGLSGIRSGWWFNNRSLLGKAAAQLDVGMIYAVVALPLFFLGLWFTRRRWRELLFGYGAVLVHTAVAVVFFGSLRTRIPVEPMICVFAAAALVTLVRPRPAASR